MSLGEYKRQMRPKVRAQMLIERMESKIQSNVKITPKEVRDFYRKIPVDSIPFISAEVEVAQIAIKPVFSPEAKEIAYEQIQLLRSRIMNGESFAKLAGLYSKDPGSKANGGLLPEFGRNDMVPEFERAAFKTKKDSISDIIETKYGYHILKIVDKRGERMIVRHILISPLIVEEDLEKVRFRIDSVLHLLRTDSISFCKAVKEFSQDDETKANCGFFTDPNLGTQRIPYDYLDKEMSSAVGSMKPGEYSDPMIGIAPDGSSYYRILFLKSETKPHVANLEEDWQRIQAMALEAKKKKELDIWAEKKRKDVYISISSHYIRCGFYDEWLTLKR
jgi:peptidyl-prolyl cis-trans isomerase SurA